MEDTQGYRNLKVYQMAFELAMQVFEETKLFPKEEKYSLTDQMRRSSRSVAANIAEGYRKRQYPKMFVSKMADSDGEAAETQVWLDFAFRSKYLEEAKYLHLSEKYKEVGRMLGSMIADPEKFMPYKVSDSAYDAFAADCPLPPASCLPSSASGSPSSASCSLPPANSGEVRP